MLTGRQIREARALLGLNRSRFANLVRTVTTATIIRAEASDDEPDITVAQAEAIARALDRVGVEFAEGEARIRRQHSP